MRILHTADDSPMVLCIVDLRAVGIAIDVDIHQENFRVDLGINLKDQAPQLPIQCIRVMMQAFSSGLNPMSILRGVYVDPLSLAVMNSDLTHLIRAAVVLIVAQIVFCGEPIGDNVCTYVEQKEEFHLERYVQSVPFRTTVWCADITKAFKCPITRIGEKVSYKSVPRIVDVNVKRCCEGYQQNGDDLCYPVCKPSCKRGQCVAPNKCECEPGYGGEGCSAACPVGFWGASCTSRCDCQNGATCDPVSGACQCPAGYKGKLCENECENGFWGVGCALECACQNGGTCNPIDGSCKCAAGFIGKLCLSKCVEGKHGPDCVFDCKCQNGAHCDEKDGTCICPAGFTGDLCNERCASGFFGNNCTSKCFCLNGNECDSVTGKCTCIGFTGQHCEQPCPKGTYGPECASKCECANEAHCHPRNGTCQCATGFTGLTCAEKICPFDRFGAHCEFKCACNPNNTHFSNRLNSLLLSLPSLSSTKPTRMKSFRLEIAACSACRSLAEDFRCHPTVGSCSCLAGFTGAGCESICPLSYYGENCDKKCDCALETGSLCDPQNGICFCAVGYRGPRCDQRCEEGYFGAGCQAKCACLNNGTCDYHFGSCNCTAGFRGAICELECPAGHGGIGCAPCNCKNGAACDPISGQCLCLAGWHGILCDGYYGRNCSKMCNCSAWQECNAVTGECKCDNSSSDAKCRDCEKDRWGENCEKSCDCHNHGTCDQLTGECLCYPGFTGPKCETSCPNGTYGLGCTEKCTCGVENACNPRTGHCVRCAPGRSGFHCEQNCPEGTWGVDCSQKCKCAHACNSVDGACQCPSGFTGTQCEQHCPEGTWGLNCSQKCAECKNNGHCNKFDGSCSCPIGFKGARCERACGKYEWGEDCVNKCECESDQQMCNPLNGTCSCPSGLMGKECQEYCHEGRWGPDCKYECSCQLSSSTCQATTGICICNAGFMGPRCQQLCSEGYYGIGCKEVCDCGDRLCDPVVGCCEKNDQFCGLTRSMYQKSQLESKLPYASLAVGGLLLLSLLLFGLVFYYRRKYVKERDPHTPTITYYPQETHSEVGSSGNEFDNPLYKQVPADGGGLSHKGSSVGENHHGDTAQNEYVTVDDSYADLSEKHNEATNDDGQRGWITAMLTSPLTSAVRRLCAGFAAESPDMTLWDSAQSVPKCCAASSIDPYRQNYHRGAETTYNVRSLSYILAEAQQSLNQKRMRTTTFIECFRRKADA
ncbi:unnamed protein product [Toxocara canis]|uniref:Multiple epidermal growth factor-like domains protein 10 n=1 Tax=Toxocara canis TaxID=6265 RepID=A0A183UA56_TOXCA|nr:unnamed protein product [Toxocara canis]